MRRKNLGKRILALILAASMAIPSNIATLAAEPADVITDVSEEDTSGVQVQSDLPEEDTSDDENEIDVLGIEEVTSDEVPEEVAAEAQAAVQSVDVAVPLADEEKTETEPALGEKTNPYRVEIENGSCSEWSMSANLNKLGISAGLAVLVYRTGTDDYKTFSSSDSMPWDDSKVYEAGKKTGLGKYTTYTSLNKYFQTKTFYNVNVVFEGDVPTDGGVSYNGTTYNTSTSQPIKVYKVNKDDNDTDNNEGITIKEVGGYTVKATYGSESIEGYSYEPTASGTLTVTYVEDSKLATVNVTTTGSGSVTVNKVTVENGNSATVGAGDVTIVATPTGSPYYVADIKVDGTSVVDNATFSNTAGTYKIENLAAGDTANVEVVFAERKINLKSDTTETPVDFNFYYSASDAYDTLKTNVINAVVDSADGGEISKDNIKIQVNSVRLEGLSENIYYEIVSDRLADSAFKYIHSSNNDSGKIKITWIGDDRYPEITTDPIDIVVSESRPTAVIDAATTVSNIYDMYGGNSFPFDTLNEILNIVKNMSRATYETEAGSQNINVKTVAWASGNNTPSLAKDGVEQEAVCKVTVEDTADYLGTTAEIKLNVLGNVNQETISVEDDEDAGHVDVSERVSSDDDGGLTGSYNITIEPKADTAYYVKEVTVTEVTIADGVETKKESTTLSGSYEGTTYTANLAVDASGATSGETYGGVVIGENGVTETLPAKKYVLNVTYGTREITLKDTAEDETYHISKAVADTDHFKSAIYNAVVATSNPEGISFNKCTITGFENTNVQAGATDNCTITWNADEQYPAVSVTVPVKIIEDRTTAEITSPETINDIEYVAGKDLYEFAKEAVAQKVTVDSGASDPTYTVVSSEPDSNKSLNQGDAATVVVKVSVAENDTYLANEKTVTVHIKCSVQPAIVKVESDNNGRVDLTYSDAIKQTTSDGQSIINGSGTVTAKATPSENCYIDSFVITNNLDFAKKITVDVDSNVKTQSFDVADGTGLAAGVQPKYTVKVVFAERKINLADKTKYTISFNKNKSITEQADQIKQAIFKEVVDQENPSNPEGLSYANLTYGIWCLEGLSLSYVKIEDLNGIQDGALRLYNSWDIQLVWSASGKYPEVTKTITVNLSDSRPTAVLTLDTAKLYGELGYVEFDTNEEIVSAIKESLTAYYVDADNQTHDLKEKVEVETIQNPSSKKDGVLQEVIYFIKLDDTEEYIRANIGGLTGTTIKVQGRVHPASIVLENEDAKGTVAITDANGESVGTTYTVASSDDIAEITVKVTPKSDSDAQTYYVESVNVYLNDAGEPLAVTGVYDDQHNYTATFEVANGVYQAENTYTISVNYAERKITTNQSDSFKIQIGLNETYGALIEERVFNAVVNAEKSVPSGTIAYADCNVAIADNAEFIADVNNTFVITWNATDASPSVSVTVDVFVETKRVIEHTPWKSAGINMGVAPSADNIQAIADSIYNAIVDSCTPENAGDTAVVYVFLKDEWKKLTDDATVELLAAKMYNEQSSDYTALNELTVKIVFPETEEYAEYTVEAGAVNLVDSRESNGLKDATVSTGFVTESEVETFVKTWISEQEQIPENVKNNITVTRKEGSELPTEVNAENEVVYTVSFAGDAVYKPGSCEITVKVTKKAPFATIEVVSEHGTAEVTVGGKENNMPALTDTFAVAATPDDGYAVESITIVKKDSEEQAEELTLTYSDTAIVNKKKKATATYDPDVNGELEYAVYTVTVNYAQFTIKGDADDPTARAYGYKVGYEDPTMLGMFNAAVETPQLDETAEPNVKYLARPEGTTLEIKLISDTDNEILQFANNIIKKYIGEDGSVSVPLGELWLEPNTEIPEVSIVEIKATIESKINSYIDNSDWYGLGSYLLDLTTEVASMAYYYNAHEFGMSETTDSNGNKVEEIKINYEDEKWLIEDERTNISIYDSRKKTSISGSAEATVTYGSSAAELLSAMNAAIVDEDGTTVAGDLRVVEDISIFDVADTSYTITIKYDGDENYQPSMTTVELTIVKAPCSIEYQSQIVKYGDEFEFGITKTPEKVETIDFVVGLDVADMTGEGATGYIQINLPGVIGSLIGNIGSELSLTEFIKQLTSLISDGEGILGNIGLDESTVEVIKQILDAISDYSDSMPDMKVKIGGDLKPSNCGLYLVGSVSSDKNYETDFAVGYLIITPDPIKFELEWDYSDANGIITNQSTLEDWFSLGAHAKEGTLENDNYDAANEKIAYLFLGVDKEGNFVFSDSDEGLGVGAYTQVAYTKDFGNTMYIAAPIVRAFAVVPNIALVSVGDDNHASLVTFDGQQHAMDVTVTTEAGTPITDLTPLTVTYVGYDANALEIYNSTTPPTNAGTYTVYAVYADYEGERFGLGMGVLVIAPAEATVTVDNVVTTVEAYDGKFGAVVTPEDCKYITVLAGVSLEEDVVTVLNIDLPERLENLLKQYALNVLENGISLNALLKMTDEIKEKLEELGLDAAFIDEVLNIIDQIPVTDLGDVTVTFKDYKDVAPNTAGIYVLGAVTCDPNYKLAADTGILVLDPLVQVNFIDDNGEKNHDRKFTYDGKSKAMDVSVTHTDGSTLENYNENYLTVTYVGYTTAGVKYNSTEAPTEAGAYAVTAVYKDTEHTLYGMAVGAMAILPAESELTVTDAEIVYGTNYELSNMIETNPSDLAYLTALAKVTDDSVLEVILPTELETVFNKVMEETGLDNIAYEDLLAKAEELKAYVENLNLDSELVAQILAFAEEVLEKADKATSITFTFADLTNAGTLTVGKYAVGAISANPNYQVSAGLGWLTITPREIIVNVNPDNKTYGDADPAFEAAAETATDETGLVNDDQIASVEVTREKGEDVRTYDFDIVADSFKVTAADGEEDRTYCYTVTIAEGNVFTINRKAVTVTVDDKEKVYGETDPILTYQISEETPLVGNDELNITLSRATGEDVGEYAITATVNTESEKNKNYDVTVDEAPASLTIKAKEVTATVTATKVYGQADDEAEITVTFAEGTLAGEDTVDAFNAAFDRGEVSEKDENVGSHNITDVTTVTNDNYVVTVTAATLTITPATITEASIDVEDPVAGNEVQTEIELSDGSFYSAELTWTKAGKDGNSVEVTEDTYAYNTVYTVTVVLTPDQNHVFADDISFDNFDSVRYDEESGTYTLVKIFAATEKHMCTINIESVLDAWVTDMDGKPLENNQVEAGTTVKIGTSAKDGFVFKGWAVKGSETEIFSKEIETIYQVTDSVTLVAVYDQVGLRKLVVSGDKGSYSVDDKRQFVNNFTQYYTANTEVTVNAVDEEQEFLYWVNDEEKIMYTDREYPLTLSYDMDLTAVYKNTTSGYAVVEYVSYYKQVMHAATYTSSDAYIAVPAGPSRAGMKFERWSLTEEEILQMIADGKTYIRVTPIYEATGTCKVTINAMDNVSESVEIDKGSTYTFIAKEYEDYKFSHWSTDSEGKEALSYRDSYTMTIVDDTVVYANYVGADETVEALPVIAMTDIYITDTSLVFIYNRSVPEGYTVEHAGMLVSFNSDYAEESMKDRFVLNGADDIAAPQPEAEDHNAEADCSYTLSLKINGKYDKKVCVRGYLTLKDTTTNELLPTIYTDVYCESYNTLRNK